MTSYFDSLQPLLPDDIRKQLDRDLLPQYKIIVENLLRLAVGAEPPAIGAFPGWAELQPQASKIVDGLKRGEHAEPSQKRPREEDDDTASSKRARTDGVVTSADDADDSCVYSLHGISVSTPIRKKVNIDIHRSTIRLTNPRTHKEEHPPIPLSAFRRAFLLPTRGKSKPHWSIVLLSSDVPIPLPKGSAAAKDKEPPSPQLVFGLDAALSATLIASNPKTNIMYPKGHPALAVLRTFLSHLPVATLEPSTAVFRSAAGSQDGGGVAGIEAYRGAKEGTLWFLDSGVLWDGKPCEFFALEHLAPTPKGADQVVEGVRTLTATGRTCSVILRRIGGGGSPAADSKAQGKKAGAEGSDGSAKGKDANATSDDEENEAVDIDFGMVDGREQEPIGRWIKARRNRFGRMVDPSAATDGAVAAGPTSDAKGKAVAREADLRNEDTEDEEDEDFEVTSTDVSDEDSGTESEADASEGQGEGDDEEGNASDEATGDEMDAEEEELDPRHHPLLRPGAMPRMSRAAVEAVVGMVEQDMMGGRRRGGAAAAESDEDEEDELDD